MARDSIIDTTTGPLWSKCVQLAWPAVMQAFLVNFYAFNDFFFVGRLGDEKATAALSSCFAILIVMGMIVRIFPTGATTLIAQYTGARDITRVEKTFRSGLVASLIWATLFGLCGYLALDWVVAINNATQAVSARIEDYLFIILLSAPAFALMLVVDGAFRARGNTRMPLLLELFSLGVNTFLNWVLVLGNLGVPAYGIEGAAIATAISRALPGVVGIVLIFRGRLGFDPLSDPTDWFPRIGRLKRMWRIGFFEALGGILYGVVYLVLNRMAGELGPAAQGGLGAGLRGIEWIAFAFADGFLVASVTIVGQNIGAGKPDRAWRGAAMTATMSMLITQAVGLAFVLFPEPLCRLVTEDPETLAYAIEYVYLMGFFMWAVGFEMSVYGALIGAGRTEITFAVSGLSNLLRVPVAAFLLFGADHWLAGLGWSAFGIGTPPHITGTFEALVWTIALTAVLKCVAYALYFAVNRRSILRTGE